MFCDSADGIVDDHIDDDIANVTDVDGAMSNMINTKIINTTTNMTTIGIAI